MKNISFMFFSMLSLGHSGLESKAAGIDVYPTSGLAVNESGTSGVAHDGM